MNTSAYTFKGFKNFNTSKGALPTYRKKGNGKEV